MEVGFIGAGRVGCSMGKYMKEQGVSVAGYYSRSMESSEEAGTFTHTKAFQNLEELIRECDLLCVSVPDDAIGHVWNEICERSHTKTGEGISLSHKIVCHFSGSLSSVVFSGIEKQGASACSVHPMLAFGSKFTSYRQLHQASLTIEGDKEAVQKVSALFTGMGNQVVEIEPGQKVLYHCGASVVSNFMIGLYQFGLDLFESCGICGEQAEKLIAPLAENNFRAMMEQGPAAALTGPIERGDVHTVERHLAALDEEDARLYQLLGKKVLSVAEKKNPGKPYETMRKILRENKER